MTLERALKNAVQAGFHPGIYRRGDLWRVHLECASNTWDDVVSLAAAAEWLQIRLRIELRNKVNK